jgi:5-methylcytosine-specific restriction endonuclease McrA
MGVRLCITPGCLGATMGTRCADCEREHQRRRNADPKRRAYQDPAYRAISLGGFVCACCGTDQDLTRHHVTPLAARRMALDPGELLPMCRSCNSSIGAHTMADSRCPQHGGVVLGG